MTGLEMTTPHTHTHTHNHTRGATSAGQSRAFIPDAVDERIRAEMARRQQQEEGDPDLDLDEYEDYYDSTSSVSDESLGYSSTDEIDEKELQRLTRERGFGLGSWLDRMVEWTLFGVDEWPLSAADGLDPPSQYHDDGITEQQGASLSREAENSNKAQDLDINIDIDTLSISDDDESAVVEKPGENGGWEDTLWFFRAIKQALL